MTEQVKEAGIKNFLGKMWKHTKDIPKEIDNVKKHSKNVDKARNLGKKTKGLHPNIAKGGVNLQKNLRKEHINNIAKGLVIPAMGATAAGTTVAGGVIGFSELSDNNPTAVKQAGLKMEAFKKIPETMWKATKELPKNLKSVVNNNKLVNYTKLELKGIPLGDQSMKRVKLEYDLQRLQDARKEGILNLAVGSAIPLNAAILTAAGSTAAYNHLKKEAGIVSGLENLAKHTKGIKTALRGAKVNHNAVKELLAAGDTELAAIVKTHRNKEIIRVAKGAILPTAAGGIIGGTLMAGDLTKKAELAAYSLLEKSAGVGAMAKELWGATTGLKASGKAAIDTFKATEGVGKGIKAVAKEHGKAIAKGLAIPAAGAAAIGAGAAGVASMSKKADLATMMLMEKDAGVMMSALKSIGGQAVRATKGLGTSTKALGTGMKNYAYGMGVSGAEGAAMRAAAGNSMLRSGKQVAKGLALPAAGLVGAGMAGNAMFGKNASKITIYDKVDWQQAPEEKAVVSKRIKSYLKEFKSLGHLTPEGEEALQLNSSESVLHSGMLDELGNQMLTAHYMENKTVSEAKKQEMRKHLGRQQGV